LIRSNRTSFCGAYWRNGFHEDGVVSALRVVARFGDCLEVQKILTAPGYPDLAEANVATGGPR
jgi:predicted NAD/FAD-binding protein